MYQDQTSQAHARHWNTQGLARVCFGQLILGAAIQVLYLILGKHDPALSILTGFLMGFGSFGVLLGAMTRGNKKSNVIDPDPSVTRVSSGCLDCCSLVLLCLE